MTSHGNGGRPTPYTHTSPIGLRRSHPALALRRRACCPVDRRREVAEEVPGQAEGQQPQPKQLAHKAEARGLLHPVPVLLRVAHRGRGGPADEGDEGGEDRVDKQPCGKERGRSRRVLGPATNLFKCLRSAQHQKKLAKIFSWPQSQAASCRSQKFKYRAMGRTTQRNTGLKKSKVLRVFFHISTVYAVGQHTPGSASSMSLQTHAYNLLNFDSVATLPNKRSAAKSIWPSLGSIT